MIRKERDAADDCRDDALTSDESPPDREGDKQGCHAKHCDGGPSVGASAYALRRFFDHRRTSRSAERAERDSPRDLR